MRKEVNLVILMMFGISLKAAAQLHFPTNKVAYPSAKKLFVLPQNFYTQHLAFTCKKEGQLQKHTGLNLFIRLGSKEYVDYLERKPGAVRMP